MQKSGQKFYRIIRTTLVKNNYLQMFVVLQSKYFLKQMLSEFEIALQIRTLNFYRIIKTTIMKIYYSVKFVILYILKNEGFIQQ